MPEFKCKKCGRTFGMAAHLARHTNAAHGRKKKKVVAKTTKKSSAKKKRKVKTAVARKKAKVAGRRTVKRSRPGLKGMSLEGLSQLITDARAELSRRIAEIQKVM